MGYGGDISFYNLTVSTPILWIWSRSASAPIVWLWCASERRCPLEIGQKKCSIFGKDLFFWSSPKFGEKVFIFGDSLFFWSLLNLLSWTKSWSRFIPPILKIGQNWGKIAKYPPHAKQRLAPLTKSFDLKQAFSRLPISQRVEIIAPMLLKAILKFCTTNKLFKYCPRRHNDDQLKD